MPSVAGHNAGKRSRAVGLIVRARLGAEGGERWWFEVVGRTACEAREKSDE